MNISLLILKGRVQCGKAGERVIDMNTHPDGDFCSVPFIVLKILWRQFY